MKSWVGFKKRISRPKDLLLLCSTLAAFEQFPHSGKGRKKVSLSFFFSVVGCREKERNSASFSSGSDISSRRSEKQTEKKAKKQNKASFTDSE